MKNIARLLFVFVAAAFVFLGQGGVAFGQADQGTAPNLNFDHNTTGFILENAHKLVACETCHTGGTFRGTPRTCDTCHAGAGGRAPGKTQTHIPTGGATCEKCHTTVTWSAARMDHRAVANANIACSTCHNNTYSASNAQGMSATHIPTSTSSTVTACDTCHTNTVSFAPASMKHTPDMAGRCNSCHSGAFIAQNAQAKSPTHVQTTDQCDVCHKTTTNWFSQTFDHVNATPPVEGRCNTCHNSTRAMGKPGNHIPTTAQCDTCHGNTQTFAGGRMNHDRTGGQCSTCHNGSYVAFNALAKPATHLPTTASCDACHQSTTTWLGAVFEHGTASPPVAGRCATCHDGKIAIGQSAATPRHLTTTSSCDTCHTNFTAFAPATMNHLGMSPSVANNCSSCHDGSLVAINAQSKPVTHVATAAQCDTCHSGSASKNYTTWATGIFNHAANAISIGGHACGVSCHNGTAGQGLSKPTSHIPTTAACDVCHSNFDAFSPAVTNHAGTTGPVAANNCSSCHGGTYTAINALTKPATHIPTTSQCDTCHTKGFATWAPAVMSHAATAGPAAAGNCATCHAGAYAAQNAQAKPSTHIPTTQSCDSCHGTTAWKPTTFSHSGVSIGGGTCATCHNGTNALGKAASHLPTSAACDVCHNNFTAFSPALMSHTGTSGPAVAGSCSTCHGGAYLSINAQVKPATHIPTSAQCDTCHTGSVSRNYTTWATGTFDHVGVAAGSCATCHNGTTALGKPTTHIPTGATCDTCHTNTTTFAPASMDHANTIAPVAVGNCASCHNGTYVFAKATAKPSTHVPTTAQCDTCHTAGYASWANASYVHSSSAVGNCATCHNGTTAPGKPSSHVPTSAQCDTCHGNYTAFKPASMNHAGTAGLCSNCHNGSYLVVNALAKSATHVPTGAQCDTCHSNGFVSFSPAPMNHVGTNSPLAAGNCSTCHSGTYTSQNAQDKPSTHVVTTAQCDTCHSGSVSKNYTTWATGTFNHSGVTIGGHACGASCHNGTAGQGLSKPGTHIPTTAACDVCHTNFTAFSPAVMSHVNTAGPAAANNCSSCHSGTYTAVNAQAKPASHITTTDQCDTCHAGSVSGNYTSWATGTFNHAGVTIGSHACGTSCHNGTVNQGLSKSGAHLPTTAACDVCHSNFTAFTPATTNHAATTGPLAAGNCSTCHSGAYVAINAQIKSATHVVTSLQCDTCHKSTTSWANASFTHDAGAAGNCATCHNGTTALGKSSSHIPTTAQCSTCHNNYNAFKPAVMSHAGTAGPAAVGNCATCHGGAYLTVNALSKPATHIPTTNQCDSCHTAGYAAWAPATMNHTGLAGQCSTCHGGAYVSQNAQTKPATHIATAAQCDTCHSGSVSKNYTTWATGVFNHTGVVAGSCVTCHNGTNALGKPGNHIPTTATCDTCHKNFTAFSPASMDHANTAGPVAAANCSTCHNGSYTFANAQTKSATHVSTTAQCDTCHKSTTTWTGASYAHAATAAGTCSTCHNGTTALGKPAGTGHIPTTAQCDTCHGNYTAFKPAAMNHAGTAAQCSTCHNGSYATQNALAKPAGTGHIPTAAQCDSCHNTGFVSFSPATMNHLGTSAPLAAGNCATCHSGTYLAQNAQNMPSTHIATAGAQCDTCHSGSVSKNYTTWATGTFNHAGVVIGGHACGTSCHNGTANQGLSKPGTHIPTTAACDVCHNSFTAFTPATMSHSGTTGPLAAGNCASCHSGTYIAVNAQSKPATHIATTQSCDTCHGTTAWKPTTFSHQGVAIGAGTCATCHGVSALGKSASHLPTTAACDVCHSNFNAFNPATMNHASTAGPLAAGNCATCHSGAYLAINAQVKSATHVATSAQCDTCHKSTSTWANATFTHDATAVGNCANCHNGTTALGKPTTHIPTTAQCSTCHNNYTAFKPAVMSHAGTTGPLAVANCSTCHGGAYVAVNALSKPTTHIPTSSQCDSCHTGGYAAWSPSTMNHTGLAGQCSTCHSGAYVLQNAQSKPATHIATTAQCDTCHTGSVSGNYTTWATGTFNHAGVVIGAHACGTSCHNGTANQGLSKPSTHIPTTAACDVCHSNFTAFTPATTNHAATTGPVAAGNCATCHSGTYIAVNAQAKPTTHILTTQSCDTCHATTAWKPTSFSHDKLTPAVVIGSGTCATCHGVSALGKSASHLPTTAACDVCHSNFTAFTPATTNHAATTGPLAAGNCSTCHSGAYLAINAQIKSATHVVTALQCDTCHKSTTVWTGASFTHDASSVGNCATCHNGTTALGKLSSHIPTTAQCSTCHNNYTAFKPAVMSHAGTTGPAAVGNCATCHGGAYLTVNALNKPVTHIPTNSQCDSCHTAGYAAWSPSTMNHTGLAGQCSTCHGGAYVAQNAQTKPVTHIATAAQCDTCHSASVTKNYTTWATGVFNHVGVVAGSCVTCHNGTNALGKPANHIPTTATCDTCHKNFTAFNPASMDHANTVGPVAAANCSTCHNGSYTFANAQAKSATHVSTTAQCDTCHKSTTVWTGASYTHAATAAGTCSTCHNGTTALGKPAGTGHIPTTAQCDTCHGNYTAFKPASMNHAGTASQCSTCHNGTYVTQNALAKPAGTGHIPTGAQCDTCHNNGFVSFAPAPMNHLSTNTPVATGNCSTCHGGAYTAMNAQAKPATHLVTAAQCDTCHSGSVSKNYTTWATGTFNHTGVVIGGHACGTSCHTGAAGQGLSKPATHIPTTAACDVCHTNFTAFNPATMSHSGTTGPLATGNCASCHSGTYVAANAQAKPVTHIPTAQSCDTCHGTTAWKPTTFSHQGVSIGGGTCGTCHGTTALGKSASHLPTTAACDVCHTNFNAFNPATMNHVSTAGPLAAGNCATCHSGAYLAINAQVKSATHVATTAQCDTCHKSTSTWANATFTHDATAVGKCSTCHNGTTALGKPTTHIPTTAQCSTCHNNYTAFKPAVMSHTGTTGPVAVANCATCHGGAYVAVNALNKPTTHIPTASQCDSCHKSGYVAWAPATMNHTGLAGQCSTCHSGAYVSQNAQSKPTTHIVTTAQCDTCHSGSVSGNYTTWATGTFNHAGVVIGGHACGTSCHTGAVGQGLSKPGTHIPTTAACDVCHTNFTAFNPATMTHVATAGLVIAGNCNSCHNGSYLSANAQAKTATHITTTQSCDACHKSTSAWLPVTFTHGVADTNCGSCHDGIKATGKPAIHIPPGTLACSACHRQTAWLPLVTPFAHTGITTGCSNCHTNAYPSIDVKPANHVPTTAGCETCHTTNLWSPNKAYAHTGIAKGTCASCHTGTYLGVPGKVTNHIPTTTPAGMPGNECSLCHTSTAVGGFATEKMNHGTMQTSCATCHDKTSPYLGSMDKITRGSGHHNSAGKDCSSSGCHRPLGNQGTAYTKWN